ncbi:MAG: helix-turn-helix domain-containing protein [Aggregatilineales bacterium]
MLRTKAQALREEGASYPEIADLLGISVGATWNLINK